MIRTEPLKESDNTLSTQSFLEARFPGCKIMSSEYYQNICGLLGVDDIDDIGVPPFEITVTDIEGVVHLSVLS